MKHSMAADMNLSSILYSCAGSKISFSLSEIVFFCSGSGGVSSSTL